MAEFDRLLIDPSGKGLWETVREAERLDRPKDADVGAGIGPEYIDKLKEQRRRKLETDRRRNEFWERQLAKHFRYGTDPKAILELEEKQIERVNSDTVKKAARRYLQNQRIEGVLVPETK